MEMTPEECMVQMAAAAEDPDRLCSFASDDGVYWFTNQTTHVGKERIRATLKQNAELVSDYTYEAGPRQWLLETEVGELRFGVRPGCENDLTRHCSHVDISTI